MTVLDGIKDVADAELVVERGAAEAIVEDEAVAVAARLMMAAVVLLAESPPDLEDVYTARLMVPPMMRMMMRCS
jgi:hypothetical protein